jgi:hypothetical protein
LLFKGGTSFCFSLAELSYPDSKKGLRRSLRFAMRRVCFPAKRFLHATKGAAEFALDNFGRRVVGWR